MSDRISEREWLRLDPTALGEQKEHCVATLRRSLAGWQISTGAQSVRTIKQAQERASDYYRYSKQSGVTAAARPAR